MCDCRRGWEKKCCQNLIRRMEEEKLAHKGIFVITVISKGLKLINQLISVHIHIVQEYEIKYQKK